MALRPVTSLPVGRPGVVASLTLVLILAVATPAATQNRAPAPRPGWPQRVTLAILPYQVPAHISEMWTPVADYLAREIGVPVRLQTTRAFEEYMGEVLRNRPELAYFNPLQYLTAHRAAGYEALVAPDQKAIGRIIVRANSPIRTLGDLRGRTIAFLPPTGMPGHLQPRALLLEYGLVAGRDYTIVEVTNHNLSIHSVVAGTVDAGATGSAAFGTLPEETRADLRVLADTPSQPAVVIASRADLDPALREAVSGALKALGNSPEGREVLRPLGWTRLLRATDAEHDSTRDFARRLGIRY